MTETQRWADPESAAQYPLSISGTAEFTACGSGFEWRVALPTLADASILLPSFASADVDSYQWFLRQDGAFWPLLPVPSVKGERPDKARPAEHISSHIDCWHSHQPLNDVEIILRTDSHPKRYLITIGMRPLNLSPPEPPRKAIEVEVPQKLSQMAAAADIRNHICSPTSVSMLLRHADTQAVVAMCRDNATGMYGSWPLAIRAAAKYGTAAAVEPQRGWADAVRLLSAGLPFCASIRFESGALPGAPLQRSAGHLVVVRGLTADGDVLVCDPAAPTLDGVPRRLNGVAFSNAWLAHRGASYIIAP